MWRVIRQSIARVERIFADYEALRRAGVNLHNGELHGMLKLVVADPADHSAQPG